MVGDGLVSAERRLSKDWSVERWRRSVMACTFRPLKQGSRFVRKPSGGQEEMRFEAHC